jgi:hypothetical protein
MTDAPGLIATVRAEIAALDVSRSALRRFGTVVGSVLLVLSALIAWRNGWMLTIPARWLLGIGGMLAALGLAAPALLRPLHRVWMGLAFALGFVMTRVILTVAFVLLFVPVGLFFKLIRRDVLHRRPDPDAPTYWIRRDAPPTDRHRLDRLY